MTVTNTGSGFTNTGSGFVTYTPHVGPEDWITVVDDENTSYSFPWREVEAFECHTGGICTFRLRPRCGPTVYTGKMTKASREIIKRRTGI